MPERLMKDSGVEWLGEVPLNWNISRIGELYTMRNTKVSDTEYQPLSVGKMGVVPQLEHAAKSDDGDNRKLVLKGDFAINSRSDRRNSCGISEYDGSVSLINTVLTPRNEMNPKYYNWLFHTEQFADEFYKWGHGIVDDLWTTKWQEMKSINIPVPSLKEQEAIANFLDEKCEKIDIAIEEAKKSIVELVTFRQKEIENALMEIKSFTKIKYVSNLNGRIGYRGYTTEDIVDEGNGALTLSPSNLKEMKMDYSKKTYISWFKYEESPEIQIEESDILFVKTGSSYGKSSIVDFLPEKSTINPQLIVFKPFNINPWFFLLALNSYDVKKQVEGIVTGGTIPTMSQEKILNFVIPFPSKELQETISNNVLKKMEKISDLIKEKEEIIEDLETYEKSLIYECVTGKREVM